MKNLTIRHSLFQDSEMPETGTLVRFNLLFILILLVFTSACTELSEYENQQVQDALSDSLLTTTESSGVEMEVIEDGLIKLRLKSSRTSSIENATRNITKISGPVFIEIYDDQGRLETEVQSDSAVHHPERAEFELFGSVRVHTADQKRLRSEYLKWERNEDLVSTPGFVTIVTPTDSINARGFQGNSNLSNYTLREVTGQTIID